MILGTRGFKAIALGSWLGYWFLYAFSGGMIFYYSTDLASFLSTFRTLSNPYFLKDFSSFFGFYNSGVIWYPNGHLQVNLLYGPLLFSLVLSTLFSLTIVLTVFGIRFNQIRRGAGPLGAVSLVPALFSGGCCSVPLGLAFLGILIPGIFTPTLGITTLVYGHPYVINLAFGIVMLLSLIYTGRRLVRFSNCAPSDVESRKRK